MEESAMRASWPFQLERNLDPPDSSLAKQRWITVEPSLEFLPAANALRLETVGF
jgi:hypothetical protein